MTFNGLIVARRPFAAFAFAGALFVLIEFALQERAVLHYGYSISALLEQQATYVVDGSTGLKLLRPNASLVRKQHFIRSNSLGLRGREIAATRSPDSVRIAVVGASTVMGVTAPDNEHTFPSLLEARLRAQHRGVDVEVINAGITGYTLVDEQAMLEKRVAPLHPDLIVLYPGFNDFAPYCKPGRWRPTPALQGLPMLAMPEWWMTDDMVLKNTEFLRRAPPAVSSNKDPDTIDLSSYRAQVASVIRSARSRGMPLLVATVARSFRPEQVPELQQALSAELQSALPCFSLGGLHRLFDRHNDILKTEARAAGVTVLELDRIIPGGDRYFSGTTHFAKAGEEAAAAALADLIETNRLLDRGSTH